MESWRPAVTDESFWRRLPAPLLRGLAYRARPCSSRSALIRANSALGMKTSPRASSVAGSEQAVRDGPDRAQVGGHVLAGGPVAARGTQREPALLVAQRDGEAVDLELRDVGQAFRRLRRRRQPQALADAGVERAQLVVAERVREAEHRVPVADLREAAAGRRAAHALRRRVRGDERGKRRLEGDQLAEQGVVLGVAELRRVVLVVAAVGTADLLDELRVAGAGGGLVERGGLLDQGGIDGERLGHSPRIRRGARSGAAAVVSSTA